MLGRQIGEAEALAHQPAHDGPHLVEGVERAIVVASGEFVDVAIQVLDAHLVVRAGVTPLQHRPEALDAVGVCLAPNVLANAVSNRLVLLQAVVDGILVGVHHRVHGYLLLQESPERGPLGVHDDGRAHAIRGAILDADHCRLADWPTALAEPLVGVLVLLQAAHVRLIDFDWPLEEPRRIRPRFADAMGQMPRALLGNVEIAMQFHGRRTLDAGRQDVDRDRPRLRAQVGALHHRPGLHREEAAARPAAVRLRGVCRLLLDVGAFAVRAGWPVRPADFRHPCFGCRIVGEHPRQFDQGQPVPICFAWGLLLSHLINLSRTILTVFGGFVKSRL